MDWNNINEDRDTSGLGPIEYDQSKVPALIRKHADNVRGKSYGQEVREAQARNAEYAGLIASEAIDISIDTKTRQTNVENKFEIVQQEMTNKDVMSSPEIIISRGDESTLNDRLTKLDTYSTGNLFDILEPELQPDINSHFSGGNAFKQSDTTLYNEYVKLFENIYTLNKDYIQEFDLGADSGGWRRFKYYVYTPKSYNKTIILGAGLHGGEKLAIVSLYAFLKLLVEDWKKYPQLEYIRNNVRLVVMPIENPYGVYVNNRINENYVDLNRNFDYKWSESTATNKGTAPMSEWATKLIASVLNKYNDAIAYIDMHNMSPGDRNFSEVYYAPLSLKFPHTNIAETSKQITGTDVEAVNSNHPMATNYTLYKHNTIAFNPEFVPGNAGDIAYGAEDMTQALKWFANHIIRACSITSKYYNLEEMKVENYNPKISTKSIYATNAGNSINTELAYSKMPNSEHNVAIDQDGYAVATFNLTLYTNDIDDIAYFTPYIYQENSTGTFRPVDGDPNRWTVYRQYFEQYTNVNGRINVVVQGIIPITTTYGECICELRGYSATGNVKIMRLQSSLRFNEAVKPSAELIVF